MGLVVRLATGDSDNYKDLCGSDWEVRWAHEITSDGGLRVIRLYRDWRGWEPEEWARYRPGTWETVRHLLPLRSK